MYPEREKASASAKVGVLSLVGSGLFIFFCCGCLGVALIFMDFTSVKPAGRMDDRQWEHLEQADVLQPDEELIGYLDATDFGAGTDLRLITDRRVVSYSQVATREIPLVEIASVETDRDDQDNWTYVIQSNSGESIEVDIGASQGVALYGVLLQNAMNDAGNGLEFEIPDAQ